MSSTTLFWSYVRKDDARENGRIRRLAAAISDEFTMQTGEELDLFIDNRIAWGEIWRERIQFALADATLFVAIITPSFFKSAECRKEILMFFKDAEELGVSDFLLPLLWSGRAPTEDDDDEVRRLIAATQFRSWSDLRLCEEDSAEHRQGVSDLVGRLLEIERSTEPSPGADANSQAARNGDDDEAVGLLDVTMKIEEYTDALASDMARLTEEMHASKPVVEAAASEFAARGNRNAAGQLLAANDMAARLQPRADRVNELGKEYARNVDLLDSNMRALGRLVSENPELYGRGAEKLSLSLNETLVSMEDLQGEIEKVTTTIQQVGSISNSMRRVAKTYTAGFTRYVDTTARIRVWIERLKPRSAD